jgi:hypothetical protein
MNGAASFTTCTKSPVTLPAPSTTANNDGQGAARREYHGQDLVEADPDPHAGEPKRLRRVIDADDRSARRTQTGDGSSNAGSDMPLIGAGGLVVLLGLGGGTLVLRRRGQH